MSGTGFGTATTTATATAAAAIKIISYGGAKQTGTEGSILPNPIVAQAQDAYRNGVPGVTINFTANNGAVPNPSSAVTDAKGLARTTLQLPDHRLHGHCHRQFRRSQERHLRRVLRGRRRQ